eukprot:m51a1_g4661 hypothetical protein (354) ;mRNA; f:91308-93167
MGAELILGPLPVFVVVEHVLQWLSPGDAIALSSTCNLNLCFRASPVSPADSEAAAAAVAALLASQCCRSSLRCLSFAPDSPLCSPAVLRAVAALEELADDPALDNEYTFMACLCASHVARGLAEGYALMAPDSIRGGASSWGPLARPWGSLDDEPSVWEFSRRASEVLGRFPGPFRTVTLVDISPDLFDGPLDALPSQFPCLRALRVVDHGVYRRPECALELARAVRRMASLRDLRWTNPPECVLREFAGFRGLREAVVFLPEGSNAWMARVPGLLGGVEALEVVAFRVVCLDSSLRRPNICQLMADLLSACWHLETLELLCATHNKSLKEVWILDDDETGRSDIYVCWEMPV